MSHICSDTFDYQLPDTVWPICIKTRYFEKDKENASDYYPRSKK